MSAPTTTPTTAICPDCHWPVRVATGSTVVLQPVIRGMGRPPLSSSKTSVVLNWLMS